MLAFYGPGKGDRVFYASLNKGTIVPQTLTSGKDKGGSTAPSSAGASSGGRRVSHAATPPHHSVGREHRSARQRHSV